MKTERKFKKMDYAVASRKRKDLIVNLTVLSIAGFIAVFLISKAA
ncbi:hypothetical protein [Flavobacterium sp. YJ01]|nr:hypothetical protein [Flavobacterium sp. YJ01]WET02433.1 hypothetical protein P0R33_22015 [Flavobacterium sp. YJ01]